MSLATQTTSTRKSLRDQQATNYHDLITDNTLEAGRLFWVFRHGRAIKRAWNELTLTEKQFQREADRRAAAVMLYSPCDTGVY